MNARKLWLVALIGILLAVTGLHVVGASPFQDEPSFAEMLLCGSDLPNNYGSRWKQIEDQAPEELAGEIAKFAGLSLGESDFLEGRAVAFLTESLSDPPRVTGIVQGVYRYQSEKAAAARYEQLLQGLPSAQLGRETPITDQVKWSFGEAKGQVIEASDPIGSAYAYWFVGAQGDFVTIVQVWVFQHHDPGPDLLDRAVLMELLPKVMGMAES